MIYAITAAGVLFVFVIEYMIQKHESNNVYSFFKSVSLYKTIEQMLIIVLSATVAIMITNAVQAKAIRDKYAALLKNLYVEVSIEQQYLYNYIYDQPEADFLDDATDEVFNELLKTYDCEALIDTVLNTDEAVMNLGSYLYPHVLSEINTRRLLLDALYNENYVVYGNRAGILSMLEQCDTRICFLMLAEIRYLNGDDELKLNEQYMNGQYSFVGE